MTSVRPGHGSTLVTRPPRGPPREGERNDDSNAWNPAPRPDPSGTPVGRSGGGGTLKGRGLSDTSRQAPPGPSSQIDVPWRSPHDRTPGENPRPVATLADLRTEPRPDHPGRDQGRDLRPGPPPPRRRDPLHRPPQLRRPGCPRRHPRPDARARRRPGPAPRRGRRGHAPLPGQPLPRGPAPVARPGGPPLPQDELPQGPRRPPPRPDRPR